MTGKTRERLEQIASEAHYARELGIYVEPLRREEGEEELYALRLTNLVGGGRQGEAATRYIRFSVHSEMASYKEKYSSGGGHEYEVPFDFSESFEIGDIWTDSLAADDYPKRVSFQTAEAFLDFMAQRLIEKG